MITYVPRLDPGIAAAVDALNEAGIETFSSCEGGPGHAFTEPTVRFKGDYSKGDIAVCVLREAGVDVRELRRVWGYVDCEVSPESPFWEIILYPPPPNWLADTDPVFATFIRTLEVPE